MRWMTAGLALSLLVAVVAWAAPAQAGQVFDAVKARGSLNCGVNPGLVGFSAPDSKGVWSGLDVDQCRAVSAAMFGDPNKVTYIPLNAEQRFPALVSGKIDMLARNTTVTLSRQTTNGILFAFTDFYDGQGFLAATKFGAHSLSELNGANVCVQTGTDTEVTMADYARSVKIALSPVNVPDIASAVAALKSGRCDAYSSDSSQLASVLANQLGRSADYQLVPGVISREPLATAVHQGDDQWFSIVMWAGQAMLVAEQYGVTSQNIDTIMQGADPEIQRLGNSAAAVGLKPSTQLVDLARQKGIPAKDLMDIVLTSSKPELQHLLGTLPGMGKALGVDESWAYRIIKQVGNYGESFDRNVGAGSNLKLARGVNALWNDGGLMYPLPVQ